MGLPLFFGRECCYGYGRQWQVLPPAHYLRQFGACQSHLDTVLYMASTWKFPLGIAHMEPGFVPVGQILAHPRGSAKAVVDSLCELHSAVHVLDPTAKILQILQGAQKFLPHVDMMER